MRHLLFILLLLPLFVFGQSSEPSFLSVKSNGVPLLHLPTLDNTAILDKELAARKPGRPQRFAVTIPVDISPENSGLWLLQANGEWLWQMGIQSVGALSLNLGFDAFVLPKGAALRILDAGSNKFLGPFTPADNDVHEQLWTPILYCDELTISLTVPAAVKDKVQLHLKNVNHDFVGFGINSLSGSCNVDVICDSEDGFPLNDLYRDQIQSVGDMSLFGNTTCTGFLVNNTAQDCTPLFMTADHCGMDASNAPSLVVYWNHENSYCRTLGSPDNGGSGDGTFNNDFNSGSVFLATSQATDFTILELDDPVALSANPYFAGWDASGIAPDSTFGVHHPGGTEKRISFDYATSGLEPWFGNGTANHWFPDWDLGVTEGGSSGSPLFNEKGQVIGQLHGGPSGCGNADLHDLYGAVHLSWLGGGTNSSSLKPWLDPTNTGITSMNGRTGSQCAVSVSVTPATTIICANTAGSFDIELGAGFSAPADVTITGSIGSILVNYSTEVAAGGSISYTTPTLTGVAAGSYTLQILAENSTEMANNTVVVSVPNGVISPATLLLPIAGDNQVATQPNFTWQNNPDASSYEIELSATSTFDAVLFAFLSTTPSYTFTTVLPSSTLYYWRVRSLNNCGISDWSTPSNFYTGEEVCVTTPAVGLPITIFETVSTITSNITLSGYSGALASLRVENLSGIHSYLGDISFAITSPSGTTALLVDGICSSLNNFNITFDDAAATTPPCPYNDGLSYKPLQPLSVFNGESPNGVWTLTVVDDAGGDGGALQSWEISFCTFSPATVGILVEAYQLSSCGNQAGLVSTVVSSSQNNTAVAVIALTSELPLGLNAVLENTTLQPGESTNLTVSYSENLAAGVYPITFSSTINGVVTPITVDVSILSAPEVSVLQSPMSGSEQVPLSTTLTWLAAGDSYNIQIGTTPTFDLATSSTIFDSGFNTYNFLSTEYLETYYWRVQAINDCGVSEYSETFSFTTLGNYSIGINDYDPFVCDASDEVVIYIFTIGESFNVATLDVTAVNVPEGTTISISPQPFVAGEEIVLALTNFVNTPVGNNPFQVVMNDGTGSNTIPLNVTVEGLPAVTNLISPPQDATVATNSVYFDWSSVSSSNGYTLNIASNQDFTGQTLNYTISNPSNFTLQEPLSSGTYYWTITTSNVCGESISEVSSFIVQTVGAFDLNGNALTLAPNPSNQQTVFSTSSAVNADWNIEILDVSGKILGHYALGKGESRLVIPTDQLPTALYFLQVTSNEGHLTLPLVVIR